MTNDEPFSMKKSENLIDNFIGKYVVIHASGNNYTPAGFFKKRIDQTFVLNPHQGIDYSEGKPVYKMIETDEVGEIRGIRIEEITLENILGFCKCNNEQLKEKKKVKE